MQDLRLIERVATGDQEAFTALFDRHGALVLGVLMRYVGRREQAEELLQEVFLAAWDQASRYQSSRGSVRTWLVLLARSRAIDTLRSSASRNAREERWVRETAEVIEEPVGTERLESEERSDQVYRALLELPKEQRRCVELAFFEGLSQSQISTRLNLPLGTVKSRYLIGMRKLKAKFEEFATFGSARQQGDAL